MRRALFVRLLLHHPPDRLQPLLEVRVDRGEEEVLLALEVRVHGAFGEPGLLGDLVERRLVVAAAGEHLRGRLDQTRARLLALLGTCQARAHAARATIRPPDDGAKVIERRVTRSARASGALTRAWRRIVPSTIFISNCAKLAPRQRRTPPPNGRYWKLDGGLSRNRSG